MTRFSDCKLTSDVYQTRTAERGIVKLYSRDSMNFIEKQMGAVVLGSYVLLCWALRDHIVHHKPMG